MADPIDMPIKHVLRALAGLLAALIVAGLVLFVISGLVLSLFSLALEEASFAGVWGIALSVAYAGVVFALPVVLIGGSIFYVAFRRFGWITSWQSTAGGAFLRALATPIGDILSGYWHKVFSLEILAFGLLGALVGAVGGLGFWWIAVRSLQAADRRDGST